MTAHTRNCLVDALSIDKKLTQEEGLQGLQVTSSIERFSPLKDYYKRFWVSRQYYTPHDMWNGEVFLLSSATEDFFVYPKKGEACVTFPCLPLSINTITNKKNIGTSFETKRSREEKLPAIVLHNKMATLVSYKATIVEHVPSLMSWLVEWGFYALSARHLNYSIPSSDPSLMKIWVRWRDWII